MILVLNGPLGVGKSTLAEALTERIPGSAWISGDALVAVNPPPREGREHLHGAIVLMVEHHRGIGTRHFVIDHLWTEPEDLDDLRVRLAHVDPSSAFHCFNLQLPAEENRRRIERRATARAVDELAFERQTMTEERAALSAFSGTALGEPFEADASPGQLAERLLDRLGGLPR